VYHVRAYSGEPFGDIQVTVRNTTGKEIHLESIRCSDATEGPVIDLGGQPSKIEFSPTVSARTAQPLPFNSPVDSNPLYHPVDHAIWTRVIRIETRAHAQVVSKQL